LQEFLPLGKTYDYNNRSDSQDALRLALALLRRKRLCHLRFRRRLHNALNRPTNEILVPLQKPFDRGHFCLVLLRGHGLQD
jgi:hypothetical protein